MFGVAEQALHIAADMISSGLGFLQQSEGIIDDPRLIDDKLLSLRASQKEALVFAGQHPVETGKEICLYYKKAIENGMDASRIAYSEGRFCLR